MQPGGILQLFLRPPHLDRIVDRRSRRHYHAQRVGMNIFPAAGNAQDTHQFSIVGSQRSCRASPTFIRFAIMLSTCYLNRPMSKKRQSQRRCADQLFRPFDAARIVPCPGQCAAFISPITSMMYPSALSNTTTNPELETSSYRLSINGRAASIQFHAFGQQ